MRKWDAATTNPVADTISLRRISTRLTSLFDCETVAMLIDRYQIGVTKTNDVIYFQIDSEGLWHLWNQKRLRSSAQD